MRAKQMVSICLVFVCCVYILCAFSYPTLSETITMNAWVWNSESYRVRLYESPDLTNANKFYSPYLLNGYPVRIEEWNDSWNSVCVSFLGHSYWVDSKYICTSYPEGTEYPLYRTTIEDISLP